MSHDQELAKATGFVIEHAGRRYLVSNWHVFAGKNPLTGENLSSRRLFPDRVEMTNLYFEGEDETAAVRTVSMPLIDDRPDEDGLPKLLWLTHPDHGPGVDVAVLPLPETYEQVFDPQRLDRPDYVTNPTLALHVSVPDPVVIIGYPMGLHGGATWIAAWVQGSIASEFSLDYDSLPRFLVDARTREGMSGSPVYFYPRGRPVTLSDGSRDILVPDANKLLGVYSGRAHADSDLGYVWRLSQWETFSSAVCQGGCLSNLTCARPG